MWLFFFKITYVLTYTLTTHTKSSFFKSYGTLQYNLNRKWHKVRYDINIIYFLAWSALNIILKKILALIISYVPKKQDDLYPKVFIWLTDNTCSYFTSYTYYGHLHMKFIWLQCQLHESMLQVTLERGLASAILWTVNRPKFVILYGYTIN